MDQMLVRTQVEKIDLVLVSLQVERLDQVLVDLKMVMSLQMLKMDLLLVGQ